MYTLPVLLLLAAIVAVRQGAKAFSTNTFEIGFGFRAAGRAAKIWGGMAFALAALLGYLGVGMFKLQSEMKDAALAEQQDSNRAYIERIAEDEATRRQVSADAMLRRITDTVAKREESDAHWKARTIKDISFEAPFDFGAGKDAKSKLPPQMSDLFDYYEVFDSGDSTNPRTVVSRMAVKEGDEVRLDSVVNGAMRQGAAAIGDTDPKFESKVTTIDGLPARRASYRGLARGRPVFSEAAFVQDGQKVWQVQVLYMSESTAAATARLLDSIHVHPNR